jgi:hypothetical protein
MKLTPGQRDLTLPAVRFAGSCENEYYVRYALTCAYSRVVLTTHCCVHNKLHFLNSLAAFAVCLSWISWSRAGSSTPAVIGLKCRGVPLCFVQFVMNTPNCLRRTALRPFNYLCAGIAAKAPQSILLPDKFYIGANQFQDKPTKLEPVGIQAFSNAMVKEATCCL